jgi:hypothetical protein
MKYTENELSLLFLKDSALEKAKKEEEIKKKCIEKIKACLCEDLNQFRENPLLVEVLTCLVEKYSPTNNRNEKKPIDKKNIVLEIFCELFPGVSAVELKKIEELIEFLKQNKLIKRLSSVSKFFLKWAFTIKKLF